MNQSRLNCNTKQAFLVVLMGLPLLKCVCGVCSCICHRIHLFLYLSVGVRHGHMIIHSHETIDE